MNTRGFSMGGELPPPPRTIDNDAPRGLRVELIDLSFGLLETDPSTQLTTERLYEIVGQSLGADIPNNPTAGYRIRAARELTLADWPRVYDVVLRLAHEFAVIGRFDELREGVNRILAGHGVVWDLDGSGRLVRVVRKLSMTLRHQRRRN